MCSADNFKSHVKRSFDLAKNPKDTLNPIEFGKKNLANDVDMFSGNAGKRDEWERQRQEQANQKAGMGSYTNTYTDENGVRRTYVSGQGDTALTKGWENNKWLRGVKPKSQKPRTILGGG